MHRYGDCTCRDTSRVETGTTIYHIVLNLQLSAVKDAVIKIDFFRCRAEVYITLSL